MQLFILDESQRRNWSIILDGHKFTLKRFEDIRSDTLYAQDLLIVHRSDFMDGGAMRADVSTWFKKQSAYILLIAGNPFDLPLEIGPKVYRRLCPVLSPIDEMFSHCFQRLLPELQDATKSDRAPNWSLIEPEPYPEHLVATYLLDVAMTISGNDEFKTQLEKSRGDIWQDIEERAKKEFQDSGGQESDWSDMECRVAAVREIFSRIEEQRTR